MHLILGGARSGKSRHAETLAKNSGKEVVYLATAQAFDEEMKARIQQHINDRPSSWPTIECPLDLPQVIEQQGKEGRILLVDCLTLWLNNLMMAERDLEQATTELIQSLESVKAEVLLVSNEITMGVVPMGELSRNYVDALGRLHQQIAAKASKVTLMVAGIAMPVKS